ncbi:MAG: hypothetical protein AB8B80_01880 [Marinicellaceae bacterium]
MLRSEKEYLSLVLRGRPNGELIKSNGREGFITAQNTLDPIFEEHYYLSLDKFVKDHCLTQILKERRIIKLEIYKKA